MNIDYKREIFKYILKQYLIKYSNKHNSTK